MAFSFSFIAAAFLMAGAALAADTMDITISSEKDATFTGVPLKYVANITNSMPYNLNSTLYIEGADKNSWITLTKYNEYVRSGKTSSVEFYITPAYGTPPDNYPFEFIVNTDRGTFTQKFAVYVMKRAELNFTTLRSEKEEYEPGETVRITAAIKNVGSLDSGDIHIDVTVMNENMNKTATINIGSTKIKRENTGTQEFVLDKYTSKGFYAVKATAYNEYNEVVGTKETSFIIKEKEIFRTQETSKTNLLYKTVTIEGTNTGNTEGVLRISKNLFGFDWLYVFAEKPRIGFENGNRAYYWECTLSPNENCYVEYKVNYWMYYLLGLLVLSLLSVMIYEIERPHITKKNYKKGGEHAIHIEIKNRSKKVLKSVTVKDFIPTVLQFAETKNTLKPTSTRKHKNGTEILWALGKLNPGEERIISYRVRPLLNVVGGIALPEAEITAVDMKGKKYTGISAKVSMG